jgi:hypothetical protein
MFRSTLVGLSLLGMLLPAPCVAAVQAGRAAGPIGADVALRPGGFLLGQAVDAQGAPVAGKPVSIRQQGNEVVATTTDPAGYFLVKGLRGGTYEIAVGESQGVFRLWAAGTAPPSAEEGALVVAGAAPVRGQGGPIGYWLSKPWVIAGGVAAAVAVPVAIHNHRVARLSSP